MIGWGWHRLMSQTRLAAQGVRAEAVRDLCVSGLRARVRDALDGVMCTMKSGAEGSQALPSLAVVRPKRRMLRKIVHLAGLRTCNTHRVDAATTFIGDYRVVRLLGAGGMGEVYLVEHPRLPRHDAVKLLDMSVSRDRQFRSRFKREADLLAALRHPNIITIYDRGEENGRLWLAMEFVDGEDTAKLLKSRGKLPLDLATQIIAGAGAALDYAYAEHRITHRDVKPANTLLEFGADEQLKAVKLADFGIAKAADESTSLTSTGITVGTMAYISPEAIEGRTLDNRADLYSLGCTAFELLTGRPPFTASSIPALMMSHVSQAPPSVTQLAPELPAHFDDVFARVLAKDPGARFQTCKEFVDALRKASTKSRVVVQPRRTTATNVGGSARAETQRAPAPTPGPSSTANRKTPFRAALAAAAAVALPAIALIWRPWANSDETWPLVPTPLPSFTMQPAPISTAAAPQTPVLDVPSVTPASVEPPTARPSFICGIDNDAEQVRSAMASFASPGMFGEGGLDQGAGNFDPCVTLSTVLVYPYGAAGSAPVHALLFHDGQYIGTATPQPYAYMKLNAEQSTSSTVVLDFRLTAGSCGACDDASYIPIKFRWTGDKVEMVGRPPDTYRG